MLLLFLDIEAAKAPDQSATPGAKALAALNKVGRDPELSKRFTFTYTNGKKYGERMAGLGLPPKVLPAMAFNTKDGHLYPFPIGSDPQRASQVPAVIDEVAIRDFCKAFLRGEARMTAPKQTKATMGPSQVKAGEVVEIGATIEAPAAHQWHNVVNDPTKDVLLIAHKNNPGDCPANSECSVLGAYMKGVAKRFHALGIDTVRVASINAQKEALPQAAHLSLSSLPAIFLIPADKKQPPYIPFAGKLKPRYLMLFVEKHASIRFKLPPLPHLDKQQQQQFHSQMEKQEKSGEKAKGGTTSTREL